MGVAASVARVVFREEAELNLPVDARWESKVEELSRLCEVGGSATHIAFLATAMLAKAVNESADLYAIKPAHSKGNPNAFSARSLCHGVVVPLASELGVHIGVNGREPLNNQPYFRMTSLGDGTPVHSRARPAFDYMVSLVDELQRYKSGQARGALRAFIAVRRRYQTIYATSNSAINVTWSTLAIAIQRLVSEDSEGGRRAQAVVAGMLDVFVGVERVESGRINDPSRHYPGDVAVRNIAGGWDKAIEVRDKVVTETDVRIFGRACLSKGVREAAVMLAAPSQPRLDEVALVAWAADAGLGLTLFYGWPYFVDQVLFWSSAAKPQAVEVAVATIEARLMAVQASPASVLTWHALTRAVNGAM